MDLIDKTGERYGRLIVIAQAPHKGRRIAWLCRCDCGRDAVVVSHRLRARGTKSCGCAKIMPPIQKPKAYATRRDPTHRCWRKMIERCDKSYSTNFEYYGGRGIKVCDRWKSDFRNFLFDMGPRPSAFYSIDRYPNPDGDYEPGNCRWATQQQQVDNQKKTIWVIVDGERITLREACRRTGLKFHTAYGRLKSGCDIDAIMAAPDRRFTKQPFNLRRVS